jgi:hypothetical protein
LLRATVGAHEQPYGATGPPPSRPPSKVVEIRLSLTAVSGVLRQR